MLIDLNTHYGFIKVTGKDASSFLQGQVSCDVTTLAPASLSVICDPKGRIQALFRLIKYKDHYYLRLPNSVVAHAHAHLKRYSIFSKVELISDPGDLWIYGDISGNIHPNNTLEIAAFHPCAKEHYAAHPIESTEAGLVDWKLLKIQAGIAEIYPETIDKFTPHNLNLPAMGAVSFTKGCYTGQEIIARMQYRGTLKQHLYCFKASEAIDAPPYTELQTEENKLAGHLVDSVIKNGETWLLASIKDSALADVTLAGYRLSPVTLPETS